VLVFYLIKIGNNVSYNSNWNVWKAQQSIVMIMLPMIL